LVFGVGLAAIMALSSSRAAAQAPSGVAGNGATGNVESGEAGARRHFQRALELYRAGHYAEALGELQEAALLDPNGKDLFFNLSLVHEKLGQLPEAVTALERFRELETDRTERERARLTIERLRGAEQAGELARTAPASAPCPEPSVSPPAPPPTSRTSPVLIGAASVAAVSFVVGTIFGAKAWSDDVKGQSTSATLPLNRLRERARRAEREALVADIAFAVSAASTATFVGVWWLSPKDPAVRAAGLTLRGYF
jgi:tetratricopeptide (TPR) repeat protein